MKKNKIKILHILQSSSFSGAENLVCQIINMFSTSNKYEMVYCSPEGPIRDALKDRNIKYLALSNLSLSEITRAIKEYKPDIIHAHDGTAIIMSALATIVGDSPKVVAHIHGNHFNMRKISLKSILVRCLIKRITKIIWVSQSAYRDYYYRKQVENKSIILTNIILKSDLYKCLNENAINSSQDYDCIFLGRLNSIKNPLRALSIFKNIIEKKEDFKAAVIGDGDLMQSCKKYINDNNLLENIFMLGYRKNPIEILSKGKILVMTSRFEGTPMSALEAMGLGLPIVSTPTDGLVDLIDLGVTGYYSDDDSVIERKILEILNSKELYNELSLNTQSRFDTLMDAVSYKNSLNRIYTSTIEK